MGVLDFSSSKRTFLLFWGSLCDDFNAAPFDVICSIFITIVRYHSIL